MTNTGSTTNPGFYSSPQAFSSVTDDWATPQDFFDELATEFSFTLDVAASKTNHKATAWYGLDHPNWRRRDGLNRNWARDAKSGVVWMNPPYGRTIGEWMRKAAAESDRGATVVCLVPSRTDTKWFQETALERMVEGRSEIRFVPRRLKFGAAKNAAPFPSAVVIFRPLLAHAGN